MVVEYTAKQCLESITDFVGYGFPSLELALQHPNKVIYLYKRKKKKKGKKEKKNVISHFLQKQWNK